MNSRLRVALLTCIITATLVYVVQEWHPPGSSSLEPVTSADSPPAPAPELRFRPPQPPVQSAQTDDMPLTSDEENNVAVYRRYSPGVVNITSTSYAWDVFLRPIPSSGSGSGVVVDREGHIVTNYHVVENARSLEVTLWDQSRYPARIVGVDPSNDLAVISVDAPETDWVPIPFGTTEGLQVGQKVLAIGNPFGLERTLTTGIISSLSRSIQATNDIVIEGVIQTDAAINSGNSGGPLLNRNGEVVGINTAIITGSSGIGFAVPVETVSRVTRDLIAYGRVRRVTMGVDRGANISELGSYAEYLDLGTDSGVLVVDVIPDSPAARAGLRGAERTVRVGNRLFAVGGDIITAIDGREITSMTEIRTVLEPLQPGDQIQVTVVRAQQRINLNLTLEEGSA